ncbi:hypothetical protein ACFWUZ_32655 [Streptomyces sp. NPDC058646]|uniref:hypothetical protein n=1 Tax=Streptomyces sp. NPDC058646 TaxID=3346574 RepID=UPI0036483292
MDRASDTTEPELPARVPENRNAVTPDLPPVGPGAPDLAGTVEKDDSESAEPAGPAAGPAADKPQEPTS